MGGFIKGDVVSLPFPFSDLSQNKFRPALVITKLGGDDLIVCMITHQASNKDTYKIPLTDNDFAEGKLKVTSYIRPNRVFTADSKIIVKKKGNISPTKLSEVISKVIEIIKN
ncbi:MAG: type II toxin-antitoxin system PemK/MazF family toxin [Ignavibacteriaceae bacterium]